MDNIHSKDDLWQKMKKIFYLLFFANILYILFIIIGITLELIKTNEITFLLFIVFLGLFELFYIMLSLTIFCSEDKFSMFMIYHSFLIVCEPIVFGLSLGTFLNNENYTIIFQVFAISGSSLILLLSIIFVIWTCKLLSCNENVKIEYIEFKI